MIPWTDFTRVRFNTASLLHPIEGDRQLTSTMGLNKVQIGNGRAPWTSQVEGTTFLSESGTCLQPTYSHGGGDSWPSFSFSPEQMEYRQASVSVAGSTPSTPPLMYDTGTLGPIVDCSGVADLILEKAITPFSKGKEISASSRMISPAPVTSNVTTMSERLIPLDTFGRGKHPGIVADGLLQVGKDDQVKNSNLVLGGINWLPPEGVGDGQGHQMVDSSADKIPKAKSEQRKMQAMPDGYIRNYRKDRRPVVTLQKSDHMRRERDRRIALKLMYKTLDSMIPKPSKKSKRDRTAIVDDALKYVRGLQQKLEKLRVKGFGVHRSSTIIASKSLEAVQESTRVCSPSDSPSGLRQVTSATGSEQETKDGVTSEDKDGFGADSFALTNPEVDVFLGCGNEVMINITCGPRSDLLSCVLEALEMLCLEVLQYSFSRLLDEVVNCNFRAKLKEASDDTPTKPMIEEIIKSVLN